MKKMESDIVKVLGIPSMNIFKLDDDYEVIKYAIDKIDEYLNRAF